MTELPDLSLQWTRYGTRLWPAIIRLRYDVYVLEQAVPLRLEIDEDDRNAEHLAALHAEHVIGTLRLVYQEDRVKIGRLAIHLDWRRQRLATRLLQEAMLRIRERRCSFALLDAQTHLTPLYESFGFAIEGDVFIDAGIPHYRMSSTLP